MDPGRGGGRPGDEGPGDGGLGYGYFNPTGISSSSSGGSSSLPVWALVLIMLGSGLVTLIFLWLCILFICRKRRARRAAVRDLGQTAWVSERDTARLNPPAIWEKDVDLSDAKHCEANNVELTFVVMAGEDQPSFLARSAANISSDQDAPPPKDAHSSSPLTVVLEEEAVPVNPRRTPPSTS